MVLHRRGAGGEGTLVGTQVTEEGNRGTYFIRAGKEGIGAHRGKKNKTKNRDAGSLQSTGLIRRHTGSPKGCKEPQTGLYLIGVGTVLMLGPVRSIGEGLVATLVFTHVGFFTRV